MKKSWSLSLILLSLLFWGCKSEDQADAVKVVSGQESFTWNADVRSQDIRLTGTASWTAQSDANCRNWCYPVKSSDKSSVIPLWVSPNLTGNARTGKVIVTVEGKKQEITVSQPAFSGDLDKYVYHLPVVFHVMYNNESDDTQNVKESQLVKILQAVNALYAENKMDIVFEMAKYDDDGEELNEAGIIRHQVDFKDFDADAFLSDKGKAYSNYEQNLKKYINIFVFRFTQTSEESVSLGLTTLPILPTDHPLELLYDLDEANDYAYVSTPWGVCINNEFIDEWQDDKTYNMRYIVATLAHELGHYLGLLHTFSEDECNEDDGCDDTPISDYENYLTYILDYIQREQENGKTSFSITEVATRTDCITGEEFVADNILDYTFTKNEVFTAQQKARTRHVLKYSPLVPGPKLKDYNTTGKLMRTLSLPEGIETFAPCPKVPVRRLPVVK